MPVAKMMSKFGFIIMAVLATGIGLYPIMYFLVERTFGLLASKTDTLLADPAWNIGFYAHIIFGGVSLLVGWSQFHVGWRARFLAWHRRLGMVYSGSVLLSGLGGLYIALHATGGMVAKVGFACLAVLWLLSTALAFYHVKAKRIAQHQRWMIASYALCLSAVTLRLWLPAFTNFMEFIPAYRIIAWLCWVPNVIVAYFLASKVRVPSSPV